MKKRWWDVFLVKEVSPGGVVFKAFLIKNIIKIMAFKMYRCSHRPRWVEQTSTPPRFFRNYPLSKKIGIIIFGVEILIYYKCKEKPERTELLDITILY